MAHAPWLVLARHRPDHAPDHELLDRYRTDRDGDAFAGLVGRYARLVWGQCRNLLPTEADAEDAFQATFLVLARSAGAVRPGAPLGPWLHGVAVRVCRNARRAAARRARHATAGRRPETDRTPSETTWENVFAAVAEEVQRLPAGQRTAFVLCGLEGRTEAEAAAALGRKVGTVSAQLSRAKRTLMARLADRGFWAGAAALGTLTGAAADAPAHLVPRTRLLITTGAMVPRAVQSLVPGVVRMPLTRMKILVACVLVTGGASAGAAGWFGGVVRRPDAGLVAQPSPPARTPPVQPLTDDIVKAWTDAGATTGWAMLDVVSGLTFVERPVPGAVPAFRFDRLKDGAVAKLPAPRSPFGLFLFCDVTDAGLKELSALTHLTTLHLYGTGVADTGLKQLTTLGRLIALNLRGTRVTDAGLKELAALDQLAALDLTDTPVTAAGLKELAALNRLTGLRLPGTGVTDTALKDLAAPKHLTTLSLANTPVTDAGLKELAGLKHLTTLDLANTPVTDAGLKELAGLDRLTTLNLRSTGVTDAGLKDLAPLTRLNNFILDGNQVTDRALAALREVGLLHALSYARRGDGNERPTNSEEVAYLSLHRTWVTDAGLKELAGLTRLVTLDLEGTRVTDAGLRELAVLKRLSFLFLRDTGVTDAGLKELAAVDQLVGLDLMGTRVTGSGAKDLAGLTRLTSLVLSRTWVTDAGLKEVAGLTHLTSLDLGGARVTDAGVRELAGLTDLATLDLSGSWVTDAGLKELAALKNLTKLDLIGTRVTKDGLAALRSALPHALISNH